MTNTLARTFVSLAAFYSVLIGLSVTARADTWVFDKQNTEIRFSWDYLGLARRSGSFLDMEGTLEFTPTDPESGEIQVSIRTASVSTGVKELDDTLKSPDFFAASQHPRITFKSTGVVKTGERTGDITGTLTLHGQSRPVMLSTTWNFTGEHPMSASNVNFQGKWVSGFSASTKIMRSDFGIKRGIPLLSDEIRIEIDAVFIRKD
jgi:polyisoprenoid-binding protein YceI